MCLKHFVLSNGRLWLQKGMKGKTDLLLTLIYYPVIMFHINFLSQSLDSSLLIQHDVNFLHYWPHQ